MNKTLREIILDNGCTEEELENALKELLDAKNPSMVWSDTAIVNRDADDGWTIMNFPNPIEEMQRNVEIPTCTCGGHKANTTHSTWCDTTEKKK